MKILIVYDSAYGNTEKIAESIGSAITDEVKTLHISNVHPSELESLDLLIVGSPTQGGKPTPAIQEFLKEVPESTTKGVSVAAFDTRFSTRLVGIFGYAARKIARNLETKGGNLISPPEGFFVSGTKGPLNEGELERAASWAKKIVERKTGSM